MIIGFEAQRIFRPNKHGMDMVALELIKHIQEIDKNNTYYVYIKPDKDICLQESENVKIRLVKARSYILWEQIALPLAIKKDHCDVLHCTSNTAPLFTSTPIILILHDVIFLEKSIFRLLSSGGTLYQKMGNLYRRFLIPFLIKKVKLLVTVSQYEKKKISDVIKKIKTPINVIYNGVGEHFKVISDRNVLDEKKEQYGLPDKFIFFMGNTDPKKNTINVLKAYSLLVKMIDIPLVMIDYPKNELINICDEIGDKALYDKIILTGYIPNTDLPYIYNLCSVFLYPSIRESFGIPIIEAQSCGATVITSNTSSMPEVAGEGAIVVNPLKPEEISTNILKALNNSIVTENVKKKGIENAKHFSWNEAAKQVLEMYNDLLLKN
jgi:glycosyltransferase involved in cell wall biosynthesis